MLTSTPAPPPHGIPEGVAHLEAITRGISPGDPVLFEQRVQLGPLAKLFEQLAAATNNADLLAKLQELRTRTFLAKVNTYSELIWFANPPEGDRIGQGPPVGPPSGGLIKQGASPLPIPHSRITFDDEDGVANAMSNGDQSIGTIVVHYGWQEIGQMIDAPASAATTTPEVPATESIPPDTPLPVLIEDATGAGVPGHLGKTNPPGPVLVPPMQALINLLPVSRGESVDEVLGSGDPMLINQEFVLQRSPLTYLRDPRAPNGYRSTLRIRVNGVEWREVESFYEQRPDARVFVTREDDEQRTYVRFGDGECGARLPAGIDNVIATYRYGSGAESPPAGSLTTISRPLPGLQSIRNPVAVSSGEDPDPPSQIRRLAPRSVLAFGRAISGDDYATIAAQTPGVKRAAVRWGWDAATQRSMVHVYVGDELAAVRAAREALRAVMDPNRPLRVSLAAPIYLDIRMVIETHPDYVEDNVKADVTARLLDPRREPFGIDVAKIGDAVYDSQICDACLEVPGVVAVHGLEVRVPVLTAAPILPVLPPLPPGWPLNAAMFDPSAVTETLVREPTPRHYPGEDRFYLLRTDRLHIATRVSRHGG